MKVRVVGIPLRLEGERYKAGTELEVTESVYKTIKSNCIIINEDEVETEDDVTVTNDVEVEEVELTDDELIKEYKDMTKNDIMIKLAENGVEYDPNSSKVVLFKMLGSD